MTKKMLVLGIALTAMAGCGGQRAVHTEPPPPRPAPPPTSKPAAAPAAAPASQQVKVPPGHMPPRGKCRIWYPGRPPGQQPPVGECADLMNRVPPGAALVRG